MQIIEEFSKREYLLNLVDFNELDKLLKRADSFIPKKYRSNNKKFVQLIDAYMEESNNISWWNRYNKFIFLLLLLLIFIIVII